MDTKRETRAVIARTEGRGLLQSLLLTLPLMLLIGIGTVLLASFAVFRQADPAAYVSVGGYAALAVTALFSGMLAGRMHRRQGWLAGGLTGLLLILCLLAVSAITGGGDTPVFLAIALHTAVFLLSLIGGVLGGARRVTRRRRRR